MTIGKEKQLVGTCRYCGCTEEQACDAGDGEPCEWADEEHECCSVCEEAALDAGLAALEAITSAAGLIDRQRVVRPVSAGRPAPAAPAAPAPAPSSPAGPPRSITIPGDDEHA